MRKRSLIIAGAVGALVVMLVVAAVAGGGVVYALSRAGSGTRLWDSLTSLGRLPVLADRQDAGESGIVIAGVADDSAAMEAGIVRGDILLELDGKATDRPADVIAALENLEPGDKIEATLRHGDEERIVSIILGDQDGEAHLGIAFCGAIGMAPRPSVRFASGDLDLGAVVVSIAPGSPADEVGLQLRDAITAVDGQAVTPDTSLTDLIGEHEPGDEITLDVLRPNAEADDETEALELRVALGQHPDDPTLPYLGVSYRLAPRRVLGGHWPRSEWIGPEDLMERLNAVGAVITDVTDDGPAEKAGLHEGDVILAIDGNELATVEELLAAIRGHEPGDRVTLSVQSSSDAEARDVAVTLGEHPDDPDRAFLGVRLARTFVRRGLRDQGLLRRFEIPGDAALDTTEDL